MAEEKVGIKESKELLSGVMVLAGVLIDRLKDGFQADDLPVILSKLGYDPKVREALKNVQAIPSELKDLDVEEIVQLVMQVVLEVPKLIEAFKKEAA
jgi:hypothetical protein